MVRAVLDGVLAVVLAVLVGITLAFGLGYLGLTDTAWWQLGPWLAGLGLLGTWQQEVTSTIGAGWTITAGGVPLLVTGAVALVVALRARRGTWLGAPFAAGGAAGAAALLVLASRSSSTITNSAGSATTTNGLSWWVPAGAAALVGVVWLLHTAALPWWRSGRAVAMGVLVWLGVVLTVGVAAAAAYLTSSTAVGIALGLLYPLAGTLVLFAACGVPVDLALTRLTPEPVTAATWDQGTLYLAGGVVGVVLLAALTGLVLRLVKHRSTWLGALTVTPALAAFLAWAMSSRVLVPDAFGASSSVTVNPLFAAVAGLGLAAVTRFFAGRPRTTGQPPAQEPDLDALLKEAGVQ